MSSATPPKDYFVRHENGSDRISIEEAKATERFPIYGILDNLRSAHNVGSIFRTSDGANAAGLSLCGYSPTPPHRHLAKTALGAVDVVPWAHYETVTEAIEEARGRGAQVLALEFTESSVPLTEFELKFPVVLVAGNEVDGLSEETIAQCDAAVHLPMFGHKNSLNVSVAFGVALYETLRRYRLEAS
ncbi:TrmH family RNA methyltransferase [bacterium]|nr:MAG: TrmH family RNA methyltransferase [bacterium]